MTLQKIKRPGLVSISLILLLIGSGGSQWMMPVHADTQKAIKAFNQNDYKIAFKEFLSSAQAGNADAQCAVGSMLMMKINPPGSGTYKDAEAWLIRAAKQGNTRAMAWLGKFYEDNAQNAALDSSNAHANANILTNNSGASTNTVPLHTINPSMNSGALSSFFGGPGRIPQQANSANAVWRPAPPPPRYVVPKSITNTQDPTLKQGLINSELNFQKARYWFQKAAENGNRYAMEQLAKLLDAGLGGPQNSKKAARWRTRMKHIRITNFTPQSNNYPMEP